MAGLTADGVIVDALRDALAADPGVANRPGQLRMDLTARLGDVAASHRAQLHQLVAAAEDNLPASLSRVAPLSSHSLLRISEELAAARGWALPTAERTVAVWAVVLGYGELVASSWPREPLPGRAGAILLPPTELPPLPPGAPVLPDQPGAAR